MTLSNAAIGAGPYVTTTKQIRLNNQQFMIYVGATTRVHDFGLSGGFVDPTSGVPRLATIVVSGPGNQNTVISGSRISNGGVPGRVEWTPTGITMASRPNEGAASEPCRAQASSYQISPDVPLTWTLQFRLGEPGGQGWPLLTSGQDPVLLWQVKAPGFRPSLALIADTDENDPGRVMLAFSELAGSSSKIVRAGTVHGLNRGEYIDVTIRAVLDERDAGAGGKGQWSAHVNGVTVFARSGPTLSTTATEPSQWFFGIYRYGIQCPATNPRVTTWKKISLDAL